MSKTLQNAAIEIDVLKPIQFCGKTYSPGTSLVAQAADSSYSRWLVGRPTGNAECTVFLAELLHHKSDGSIDCSPSIELFDLGR